jgi:two-component system, NarL family, invasion response regulator UvrY
MSETTPPRVFLVDDHPAMLRGLAILLEQDGLEVCGEAQNRNEMMAQIDTAKPDLALLDISLDTENGLDLIADFRARAIKVVCYSMLEDAAVIKRAIVAGAGGYVTKREPAENLLQAIRDVLAGKHAISPLAGESLSTSEPTAEDDIGLSVREAQIISLIGQGIPNVKIAAMLRISVRTLEAYCSRIMAKLNLRGMQDFRQYAIARQAAQRVTTD